MTDAPASSPRSDPERRRRGGLFRRIYLSFILTVVAFAALVGLAVLTLASPYDAAWVESVDAAVTAREPTLTRLLADRPAGALPGAARHPSHAVISAAISRTARKRGFD